MMTTLRMSTPAGFPQVLTLTERTLGERWRSVLGWTIGLALMAALQLSVYPSVVKSSKNMQAFVDEWPQAFREAFNLDAYTTGSGFLNAEMFSIMVPLVLIAVAASGGAAATAGEEERGTADLLLSLPVSRTRAVLAKVLATIVSVVVTAGVTFLTIAIGGPIVDLDVGAGNLAAALVMTGALALFFGALALAIGAATGHRTEALGVSVGLALAAFLLNALAPMADWLEPWQKASPFHWAVGNNPLDNGVDVAMLSLMLGLAVLLTIAAVVAFNHRDVRGR